MPKRSRNSLRPGCSPASILHADSRDGPSTQRNQAQPHATGQGTDRAALPQLERSSALAALRGSLLLPPLLVLLACAAVPAAYGVKVLSSAVLGTSPVWVANRSADIILDFRKADPLLRPPRVDIVNFRGKDVKVHVPLGYFHGNVAIVRFGNRFIIAVRKMHFYKMFRTQVEAYPLSNKPNEGEISWWASKIAVCSADSHTLQPIHCEEWDPRDWPECLWNKGFEGEGVEDPRLIVWPGKGLFIMFGSKPRPVNPNGILPEDTKCEGPWAFQPYLKLVAPYSPEPDPTDPWSTDLIRLQYLSGTPQHGELLKEKNWNPFIYKGRLYFSQSFDPHVVLLPSPNGTCTRVFETTSRVFRNLTSKPRGNTQAVLVPAAFSGEPRDYYLGVVHAESRRSYLNYFYKMQAHPPFRIYALSKAMPIINSKHPRNPVWTSVSFPMSLDLIPETNQVMIGYGSGDQIPRVKMMPWGEVRALFPPVAQELSYAWRFQHAAH